MAFRPSLGRARRLRRGLLGSAITIVPPLIGAPTNAIAPGVIGTAQEGQILSVSNGTWSNTPTSYTYQWLRAGVAISGSVNATRTLTAADVGAAMTCTVTAANAGGSNSATSAATAAVIAAAVALPANTVAPAITGTGTVGQTLTTSNGTWDNSPTGYAYQWRRAGVDITGATSATYVLVSADSGQSITCRVIATNAGGSAGATSNAIAVATGTLSITSTPTPRSVGDSTVFSPAISGGTTPYALAQTGGRMAPGRALSGLNVTGAYTHPGTWNYQLTVTDSANPAATALLNAKAIVAGVTGDEAVMNPLPTAPRSTYDFAFTGRLLDKVGAGMTDSYGPYWPQIVDVRTDPFWQPLGIKFLCYLSTDHADGSGGVYLIYTKLADPTDITEWVTYDAGLAAGDFASVTTKPTKNPIFIGGAQLQTETPRVRKYGTAWVMTYQIKTVNGYRNQATCRVVGTDGLNWTGTKTVPLLFTTVEQCIGDGHTGYFDGGAPNPYPRAIYPYDYIGFSLNGGQDFSTQAVWGTNDPVAGAWTFIENLIPQSGRLSKDRLSVTDHDAGSVIAVRQGFSFVSGLSTLGSGGSSTVGSVVEAVAGPNGYDVIGTAIPLMSPAAGGTGPLSDATQGVYLGTSITLDDRRVMIFQGDDASGTNSHANHVAIASSPRRNPQNSYFAPLEPPIPGGLTTRQIDFKTASALPAWLTPVTNGSFTPTFDATNGFGIDAPSSATVAEYYLFGEEIPAGTSFVDMFYTDERAIGGTAYRSPRLGIVMTTAAVSAISAINANGMRWRNLGTGGIQTYKAGLVGGSETGGAIVLRYPGFGHGTVSPRPPRHCGIRWFINSGRCFLLAEGKSQWGIEYDEVTVPAALKPGGASFSGVIRPWFGFSTVANQAVQERYGAVRYRFG